jgi:hypothetical protein
MSDNEDDVSESDDCYDYDNSYEADCILPWHGGYESSDDDGESFAHGDNDGEYADDDESAERVIEQLRKNGLSLLPGDLTMHSSLPEPVQVELAKAERQDTIVERVMLRATPSEDSNKRKRDDSE